MTDATWLCNVCGKSNAIDLPKCATCGRPSTYIPPTLDDLEGSLLEARVAASAKDAAVRQAEAAYAEATEAELAAEAELEEFKRRWEEEKAVWVSDPEVAAERAAPAKDGTTPKLLLPYSGVETSLVDGMIHTKQSMMRRGTKELAGEPVARIDSINEDEARDDETVNAGGGDADSTTTTGGELERALVRAPPSSAPRGRAERLRGAGGGKGSKEKTKKGKGKKKKGRR